MLKKITQKIAIGVILFIVLIITLYSIVLSFQVWDGSDNDDNENNKNNNNIYMIEQDLKDYNGAATLFNNDNQQKKLLIEKMNNKNHRPLLRNLIDFQSEKGIIGNVDFLLDFAIIGQPKCGTTALAAWLQEQNSTEISMLDDEVFCLLNHNPARLVHRLYLQLPRESYHKRGYKNPMDIRTPHSLQYIQQYFPTALLIVGIRHPVTWFESLYNFKVQNLARNIHPSYWGDPNTLIGQCNYWNETNCVGTNKGVFHVHLSMLRNTTRLSLNKWKKRYPLIFANNDNYCPLHLSATNPIFLYEFQQLSDSNNTRQEQFRFDLSTALKLQHGALNGTIPKTKPDFDHFSIQQQTLRDQYKIDICLDKYKPVRTELMKIANEISTYILDDFLPSKNVIVSSPDYLIELLADWNIDPCAKRNSKELINTK